MSHERPVHAPNHLILNACSDANGRRPCPCRLVRTPDGRTKGSRLRMTRDWYTRTPSPRLDSMAGTTLDSITSAESATTSNVPTKRHGRSRIGERRRRSPRYLSTTLDARTSRHGHGLARVDQTSDAADHSSRDHARRSTWRPRTTRPLLRIMGGRVRVSFIASIARILVGETDRRCSATWLRRWFRDRSGPKYGYAATGGGQRGKLRT